MLKTAAMKSKGSLWLSLFAATWLVTACSDDSTTPEPFEPPPDPTVSNSIAAIASSNPDFSILVAALSRAGLVDVLDGPGPFTVFAPNNQAFIDSGITDVNAVSVEDLERILLYHVVAGQQIGSAEVKAGAALSAADLTFFIGTEGGVTLNGGNSVMGGARVTSTDIVADNGVIHVIDRVILPPDIPTAAGYAGLTELVGAVVSAANLEGGVSVLEALGGEGPFTVFAPTNAAFDGIGAPVSSEQLRDVLLYHVIGGASVDSKSVPFQAGAMLRNKWDNPLTLLFDTSSGVKVNGAMVVLADVKTTNGIVHVIDRVLLPPNAIDMAGIAGLTELAGAIGAAATLSDGTSVLDALKADQPYTIFAPTNSAFQAISAPSDPGVLRDVLLMHVVMAMSPVLSSDIPGGSVTTLNSAEELTFDASMPSVSSDGTSGAMIGPYDINVTNGVIHVIDKVLLP